MNSVQLTGRLTRDGTVRSFCLMTQTLFLTGTSGLRIYLMPLQNADPQQCGWNISGHCAGLAEWK